MSGQTRRMALWAAACMAALGVGGMIGQPYIGAAFALGGLVKALTNEPPTEAGGEGRPTPDSGPDRSSLDSMA